MSKKLSVIIPCYNVESYIDRCMESLLNQTIGVSNMELIFVNDCSTDKTYNILIEYEKQYPESILIINLDENKKQGGARNVGLSYATAEYIGYVDSDDWIEPSMYEKLYNKAIEYNCDLVTCEYKRDFGDGSKIEMGLTGNQDKFTHINSVEKEKSSLWKINTEVFGLNCIGNKS